MLLFLIIDLDFSYVTIENLFDKTNTNIDDSMSFKCAAPSDFHFNSSSSNNDINATLTIENLQVRAFFSGDEDFGSGKFCLNLPKCCVELFPIDACLLLCQKKTVLLMVVARETRLSLLLLELLWLVL